MRDMKKKMEYDNEYIKRNYDRIQITIKKAEAQRIRDAASAAGMSVNAFVLDCVRDRIGSD